MENPALELTYPPRVAARLTGLSLDVLRAWEKRHSAVSPVRTTGGTRRYRSSDLERLRLLKAAVDAGARIGDLASLSDEALVARCSLERKSAEAGSPSLGELITALRSLDAPEVHRRLAAHLASLGASQFAKVVATPLAIEIGRLWTAGELSIAAEHLATATLRTQLGSVLQASLISRLGPRVIFATPPGERHEVGLLMAAVVAMGAGANPIYLGTDVPVEDLVAAASVCSARAVALSLVSLEAGEARLVVDEIRDCLPDQVGVLLGGEGSHGLDLTAGVSRSESLEQLESHVALLVEESR